MSERTEYLEMTTDELASLRAENERLRKALGKVQQTLRDTPIVHRHGPESAGMEKCYQIARAALGGE